MVAVAAGIQQTIRRRTTGGALVLVARRLSLCGRAGSAAGTNRPSAGEHERHVSGRCRRFAGALSRLPLGKTGDRVRLRRPGAVQSACQNAEGESTTCLHGITPMLLKIACRMLLHKKARFAFTLLGLGTLFLLSTAQVGLMIGWINTITGVMAHADADIWIMAGKAVSWD